MTHVQMETITLGSVGSTDLHNAINLKNLYKPKLTNYATLKNEQILH